ncbi:MAG: hypothetical protein ACE5ES_00465 [Candidatus Nanoarchaeia archaeon]
MERKSRLGKLSRMVLASAVLLTGLSYFGNRAYADFTITQENIDTHTESINKKYAAHRIVNAVAEEIKYKQEPEGEDYWPISEETEILGTGDCVGINLRLSRLLTEDGIENEVSIGIYDSEEYDSQLEGYRFELTRFKNGERPNKPFKPAGHFWVEAEIDGIDYILDATRIFGERIVPRGLLSNRFYKKQDRSLYGRKFEEIRRRKQIIKELEERPEIESTLEAVGFYWDLVEAGIFPKDNKLR